MTHSLRFLAAILLLGLSGCSQAGFVPESSPMPAARAGLEPEYRIFYDSLIDHGDWILIEPLGFVFRPRVNFVAWQPYDDGFWVPTDLYGWVWVSSEPFGWATYHYGRWFYDDYRGWVWVPGLDWGPAWVNWYAVDSYVGWSPRLAAGSSPLPEAAWSFVTVDRLAAPNVGELRVEREQLGPAAARLQRIDTQVEVNGVVVPAGPRFQDVERVAGPLTRVKIQDLVAPGAVGAPREGSGAGKKAERENAKDAETASPNPELRRAGEQAAREAQSMISRKQVGSVVPVVRPIGVPDARPPAKTSAGKKGPPPPKTRSSAPPDSAR